MLKWSGYLSLRSVAQQLNSNNKQEKQLRRETLIKLFDSLRYLARQGLATREHNDLTSNYHQLLHLRAQDSVGLRKWLHSENYNKWLSHEVESEMLERLSHALLRQLADEIRSHEYFALVADETTDISRVEQVSLCIRMLIGFSIYTMIL